MGKIMEAVFCVFYLVFGDAFHLVPRILAVVNPQADYTVSLGI